MFLHWSDLVVTIKKNFGSLAQSNPKMVSAYQALDEASAENNVLDAKTRELISLAVAITTRCDGCIGAHSEAAIKAGAAYIFSLHALEAYDALKS